MVDTISGNSGSANGDPDNRQAAAAAQLPPRRSPPVPTKDCALTRSASKPTAARSAGAVLFVPEEDLAVLAPQEAHHARRDRLQNIRQLQPSAMACPTSRRALSSSARCAASRYKRAFSIAMAASVPASQQMQILLFEDGGLAGGSGNLVENRQRAGEGIALEERDGDRRDRTPRREGAVSASSEGLRSGSAPSPDAPAPPAPLRGRREIRGRQVVPEELILGRGVAIDQTQHRGACPQRLGRQPRNQRQDLGQLQRRPRTCSRRNHRDDVVTWCEVCSTALTDAEGPGVPRMSRIRPVVPHDAAGSVTPSRLVGTWPRLPAGSG